MGARKQAKGRVGRRQSRQAPQRIPERKGLPATSQASPPPEPAFHKKSLCRPGSARGCKGRSPLHKITYSHPLPAGKSALRARVGGMGARKQVKGRVNRRQSRHAPRRVSLTPAAPATPGQAPRRGTHPAHRRTYPLFLSQNYCNRGKYVVKCYSEDSLVP